MTGGRFRRSTEWLRRAEARVPGASQTFSKGANQFVRGASPLFLERGQGARVWDVDGHEFLDTTMALCAVSLGYADPDVDAAVTRQLGRGVIFTLPHPLEAEVAELLCRVIPCAEMVRFGKNGSDATSGAVRLARAFTGRDVIVACGYHGWQDWYVGTTTRNLGVPKSVRALTRTFAYNRIETLEQLFDEHSGQIAAVIMEPVGIEAPRPGFLESVRALCTRHGTLLIFDEIVTGFRLAPGGGQEHFGVLPDLACFGKGMSNGFPLAALVGRREIMALLEEVFFSFTAGGETVSLAACLATVQKLEREAVIPRLWRHGVDLRDRANRAATASGVGEMIQCAGLGPRTVMTFMRDDRRPWWELKSLFQQECVRRGLLFTGAHNMALAHGAGEVDAVAAIYDEVFPLVADAVRRSDVTSRLEGLPLEPVFRNP
jgi:glutamate-1-semialdehyde aminotransferase